VTTPRWDVLVDGLGRLEAPCLDLDGNLCFSDIAGDGGMYRLGGDGQLAPILQGRPHIGGLVAHADGGLVATGRSVSVIQDRGERVVLTPDGGWGFNDLTTDPSGAVFVGMHGERPTATPPTVEASLWRIASTGAVSRCYGGIQLTNGLGVSPDGKRLYHNDTLPRVVWVSELSAAGLPLERRIFHELRDGMPDGMALDEVGAVWVAAIGAGKIVRITPDGDEDLVLEAPMPYVSAVCFSGSDRRDLCITTFGGPPYDPAHTGSVMSTRVDVAGAGITPARV
jgi:sugar lactone lactonase YvrE